MLLYERSKLRDGQRGLFSLIWYQSRLLRFRRFARNMPSRHSDSMGLRAPAEPHNTALLLHCIQYTVDVAEATCGKNLSFQRNVCIFLKSSKSRSAQEARSNSHQSVRTRRHVNQGSLFQRPLLCAAGGTKLGKIKENRSSARIKEQNRKK